MTATLHNQEEAWRYVINLGFCPAKAPGWIPETQRRMCNLSNLFEYMGGEYPFTIHTQLYTHAQNGHRLRYPWLSTIEIEGQFGKLSCPLSTWRDENNPESAHISWYSVSTPEGVRSTNDNLYEYKRQIQNYGFIPAYRLPLIWKDEMLFESEAERRVRWYLRYFKRKNPTWHVEVWESKRGGSIERPNYDMPALVVQIEQHEWSR